eukprot:CAMPEP_0195288336 /NCGR_PEP_ID=MMETSP0707-20130614/5048_1 /TAXON_ID=33640 /ORGANISM="Asterionellopsis glacialis, Strain CCMP134" /LENGTH=343 /DNA_ID=CAMNT_0040348201 /DNA_START=70 /DNA_END=1101 /DNA_ORIENTATION=-
MESIAQSISVQMREWSNSGSQQNDKKNIIPDKLKIGGNVQMQTTRRRKHFLFTPMRRDLLADDEPSEEILAHMTLPSSKSSCPIVNYFSSSKNNKVTVSKIERKIEGNQTLDYSMTDDIQKPTIGGLWRKKAYNRRRQVVPLFSRDEDVHIRTFLDGQKRLIHRYSSPKDMRGSPFSMATESLAQTRINIPMRNTLQATPTEEVLSKSLRNVQKLANEQGELIQAFMNEQKSIMDKIQRRSLVKRTEESRRRQQDKPIFTPFDNISTTDNNINININNNSRYPGKASGPQSFPGLGLGIFKTSNNAHGDQDCKCTKCSNNLIPNESASIFYCDRCDMVLPMRA